MLMVDPAVKARFSRLQTRWRDPLLTTLTIMLAVMLFVLAPLQATGIVKSDTFAIALILISTAALFVVSGNLLTIVAILVAIGFSAIAAALRVRHLTLALYFDATAWALLGVSVGWVVARAVFGPGDVTYHRNGRDIAVSRRRRDLRGALHVRRAERTERIFRHTDGQQPCASKQFHLLQLRHPYLDRLRRNRAG
jgi:hypothetical protein